MSEVKKIIYISSFQICISGAKEMVQWLRELIALPKHTSLAPVTSGSSQPTLSTASGDSNPLLASTGTHT